MCESPLPSGPRPDPSEDRPRTPWAVHLACYALLGGLLVYVLVGRYLRPLVLPSGISVESGQSQEMTAGDLADEVDQRIDPNVAGWAELTSLPRIGEVTAKRIVAYREAHQASGTADRAASGPPIVFSCPEDLEAVHGIGPKTVARIAPYLVFSGSPPRRPAD